MRFNFISIFFLGLLLATRQAGAIGTTELTNLPPEMIKAITDELDARDTVRFSATASRYRNMASLLRLARPEAVNLSEFGFEGFWFPEQISPSHLENLSVEQIVKFGFTHTSIIQNVTKKLMKSLTKFESEDENIMATMLILNIWENILNTIESQIIDEISTPTTNGLVGRLFFATDRELMTNLSQEFRGFKQGRNSFWNKITKWVESKLKVSFNLLELPEKILISEKERFLVKHDSAFDAAIALYQYFIFKELLKTSEPFEDLHGEAETTLFESAVFRYKSRLGKHLMHLPRCHRLATPEYFDRLDQNTKNFLLPIQKFSASSSM